VIKPMPFFFLLLGFVSFAGMGWLGCATPNENKESVAEATPDGSEQTPEATTETTQEATPEGGNESIPEDSAEKTPEETPKQPILKSIALLSARTLPVGKEATLEIRLTGEHLELLKDNPPQIFVSREAFVKEKKGIKYLDVLQNDYDKNNDKLTIKANLPAQTEAGILYLGAGLQEADTPISTAVFLHKEPQLVPLGQAPKELDLSPLQAVAGIWHLDLDGNGSDEVVMLEPLLLDEQGKAKSKARLHLFTQQSDGSLKHQNAIFESDNPIRSEDVFFTAPAMRGMPAVFAVRVQGTTANDPTQIHLYRLDSRGQATSCLTTPFNWPQQQPFHDIFPLFQDNGACLARYPQIPVASPGTPVRLPLIAQIQENNTELPQPIWLPPTLQTPIMEGRLQITHLRILATPPAQGMLSRPLFLLWLKDDPRNPPQTHLLDPMRQQSYALGVLHPLLTEKNTYLQISASLSPLPPTPTNPLPVLRLMLSGPHTQGFALDEFALQTTADGSLSAPTRKRITEHLAAPPAECVRLGGVNQLCMAELGYVNRFSITPPTNPIVDDLPWYLNLPQAPTSAFQIFHRADGKLLTNPIYSSTMTSNNWISGWDLRTLSTVYAPTACRGENPTEGCYTLGINAKGQPILRQMPVPSDKKPFDGDLSTGSRALLSWQTQNTPNGVLAVAVVSGAWQAGDGLRQPLLTPTVPERFLLSIQPNQADPTKPPTFDVIEQMSIENNRPSCTNKAYTLHWSTHNVGKSAIPVNPITIGLSWNYYYTATYSLPQCEGEPPRFETTTLRLRGTEPMWKVRNSWGVTWGESGYLQKLRGCTLEHLEQTEENDKITGRRVLLACDIAQEDAQGQSVGIHKTLFYGENEPNKPDEVKMRSMGLTEAAAQAMLGQPDDLITLKRSFFIPATSERPAHAVAVYEATARQSGGGSKPKRDHGAFLWSVGGGGASADRVIDVSFDSDGKPFEPLFVGRFAPSRDGSYDPKQEHEAEWIGLVKDNTTGQRKLAHVSVANSPLQHNLWKYEPWTVQHPSAEKAMLAGHCSALSGNSFSQDTLTTVVCDGSEKTSFAIASEKKPLSFGSTTQGGYARLCLYISSNGREGFSSVVEAFTAFGEPLSLTQSHQAPSVNPFTVGLYWNY
jgi:hypothetical protein